MHDDEMLEPMPVVPVIDPVVQILFILQDRMDDQARLLEGLESYLAEIVRAVNELIVVDTARGIVNEQPPAKVVASVDTTAIAETLVPILKQLDNAERFDALTRSILELSKKQTRPATAVAPRFDTAPMVRELADIKRAFTDQETRLDYTGGPSGSPTYVGKNFDGTATSAATWIIQKLTYSGADLVRVQNATGVWDDRAGLF